MRDITADTGSAIAVSGKTGSMKVEFRDVFVVRAGLVPARFANPVAVQQAGE